jgi:hypothetical protein
MAGHGASDPMACGTESQGYTGNGDDDDRRVGPIVARATFCQGFDLSAELSRLDSLKRPHFLTDRGKRKKVPGHGPTSHRCARVLLRPDLNAILPRPESVH